MAAVSLLPRANEPFEVPKSAFLLALAWLLVLEPWLATVLPGHGHAEAQARVLFAPKRFTFKIDPKTPVGELLPTPPDPSPAPLPWLVKDLKHVPEVRYQKAPGPKEIPLPDPVPKRIAGFVRGDPRANPEMAALHDKTMEAIAHGLAKINHLNKEGTDHFMKVLLENRPDLAGLPWAMGDACRTSKERSQAFLLEVSMLQNALASLAEPESKTSATPKDQASLFWKTYRALLEGDRAADLKMLPDGECLPPRIAALMQMLGPQSAEFRIGLVMFLHRIDHPDAGRALARLAVYSLEKEVRTQALAALKERPRPAIPAPPPGGPALPLAPGGRERRRRTG